MNKNKIYKISQFGFDVDYLKDINDKFIYYRYSMPLLREDILLNLIEFRNKNKNNCEKPDTE
jgi:hypothetical protein